MTFEIGLVLVIIAGAMVVFALEIYPIDFVAFAIMGVFLCLSAAGVLPIDLQDCISGFSNPATITVMAMFILSGGIYRTGAIHFLARRVTRMAGSTELGQISVIMLVVGPISMFINNTAAVAILIPMVLSLAREKNRAASKLLIPLSFTSQLAGVVTLIGTSTNILASSLLEHLGVGALGMFEFSAIGAAVLVTGVVYIFSGGRLLLPDHGTAQEITEEFKVQPYLTEVIVTEDSSLDGKTVTESRLGELYDIDVLEILRDGAKLAHPLGPRVLRSGDILFVRGGTKELLEIKRTRDLALEPEVRLGDRELQSREIGLMEVVVSANSTLLGGTLVDANFRARYNCTVIAIRKHGTTIRERLHRVKLSFGDTLLLQGPKPVIERLKFHPDFIGTALVPTENYATEKIPLAVGIVTAVVVVAALGIQPILVTAIEGCVAMVLFRVIKIQELHESIRWDVIFLLAGVIPLGLALEKTGGAHLLADLAAKASTYVAPIAVLYVFYFFSMLLTELISNNATVVLLIPVGVATAQTLGLDPKAVALCIMFAASTSFSTPVGYQTNTMVYGPGGYKFLDFTRVGAPLNILLLLLTPVFVYYIWGI